MEKSQEIRSRIKSTIGTRKITKAMEMIASSKIKKAQNRIFETRAFMAGIVDVITDIAGQTNSLSDPLLMPHKEEKTVLILGVTADRGLCGGYNSNIIRLIEKTVKNSISAGKTVKLFIIGTRGRNYFRYMGYDIEMVYENLSDYPRFLDAREISREIISRYIKGEVDRVIICFTKFKNPAEQLPTMLQLLPIVKQGSMYLADGVLEQLDIKVTPEESISQMPFAEILYDPSPREVLESIILEYIYTTVYGTLLEATASETGARMTAMKSASKNADDMIKELVLIYHRARQQQITMEISEIISGTFALINE